MGFIFLFFLFIIFFLLAKFSLKNRKFSAKKKLLKTRFKRSLKKIKTSVENTNFDQQKKLYKSSPKIQKKIENFRFSGKYMTSFKDKL